MPSRALLFAIVSMLAILVASCAVPPGDVIDSTGPEAAEATSAPITTSPMTTEEPAPVGAEAEVAGDRAAMVMAVGLGLSVDEITVGEVQPVDWPDTSLGCPLPGMAYAEVITPGYRVTVTAAGIEYDVHMDTLGTAIVCGPDGSPLSDGKIMDSRPWMPVEPVEPGSFVTPVK